MQISPVSMRGVSQPQVQTQVQPQVQPQKKGGGVGKAIASAVIPGLGQLCDDRTSTGLKFLGGVVATGIGARLLAMLSVSNLMKSVENGAKSAGFGFYGALLGGIALGLTSTGLWITNIVDAYNGKKA